MKKPILLLALVVLSCQIWADSKGKDFLFSLALPGYSQVSSGKSYGYAMLATEATLIGTMYYLGSEADLMKKESYTYALKYAHIDPSVKDPDFLMNLGKYNSSGFDADGYNASIRREAIYLYPDNPVAQQAYIDENSYGEDRYWRWDDTKNRKKYNKYRNDADDLESYSKLAVGVLILNHLASGIDVLRYYSQEQRVKMSFGYTPESPLLILSYPF